MIPAENVGVKHANGIKKQASKHSENVITVISIL